MFNFARNYKPLKMKQANLLKKHFREFEEKFPTEQDSVEELVRKVEKTQELSCKNCGSTHLIRQFGSKVFKCAECLKMGRIFAGTFYHKMRKARLWHAATWLTERRVVFNAWQLHVLCDVAYSSALVAFRKIAKVIHSQMAEIEEWIPSGAFIAIFVKRSKETPKGEHPRFEEIMMDESESASASQIASQDFGDSDQTEVAPKPLPKNVIGIEKEVYELISDEPIHVDHLCQALPDKAGGEIFASLTMLELDDLIEPKGGDYYVRKRPNKERKSFFQMGQLINSGIHCVKVENFIEHIRNVFHGISRKYLQLYLAVYYATVFKNSLGPDKLIEASWRHDPFPYGVMIEFVSPPNVLMGN